MVRIFRGWSSKKGKRFISDRFSVLREINKKYSRPRITMTPMTRIVLLVLRIYLLLLVAILFYKFATILMSK
jgi:hypothetical protein